MVFCTPNAVFLRWSIIIARLECNRYHPGAWSAIACAIRAAELEVLHRFPSLHWLELGFISIPIAYINQPLP